MMKRIEIELKPQLQQLLIVMPEADQEVTRGGQSDEVTVVSNETSSSGILVPIKVKHNV